MDDVTEHLERARKAYAHRDWAGAREGFAAARERGDLLADDLYALADSAWRLGDVDESSSAGEEAYRRFLLRDQPRRAAMAAMGVAVNLFLRGDDVLGSGWMSRVKRLLQDEPESPEHGYVLYLLEVDSAFEVGRPLGGAELDALIANARRVQEMGHRHGDPDLVAVGVLGEGRGLVKQGRVPEGLALLDESMVTVLSEELTPEWAGNIYCHLMAACHELGDIRRAAEWTEAMTRWVEGLPAAVLFTGICRVHRSQVLQTKGAWEGAEREAVLVCEQLEGISVGTVAEGHYQLGEIRRLRGDLAGAEGAYRRAHQLGRDPQPGLALLRLAQGRVDTASASIRAALAAEPDNRLARARLCCAQAEIALAAGDLDMARSSRDELESIASSYGSSGLKAMALAVRGAVALAEGPPEAALPILRAACRRWQDLDAP
jgi:tetratricopeptide (TPR) repeat protein